VASRETHLNRVDDFAKEIQRVAHVAAVTAGNNGRAAARVLALAPLLEDQRSLLPDFPIPDRIPDVPCVAFKPDVELPTARSAAEKMGHWVVEGSRTQDDTHLAGSCPSDDPIHSDHDEGTDCAAAQPVDCQFSADDVKAEIATTAVHSEVAHELQSPSCACRVRYQGRYEAFAVSDTGAGVVRLFSMKGVVLENIRLPVRSQDPDLSQSSPFGAKDVPGRPAPWGLVFYDRYLAIVDSNQHNVSVWNIDNVKGGEIQTFGRPGESGFTSQNGTLWHPKGICRTVSGHLVVCDSGNHRIQVYAPAGTFVRKFGYGILRDPSDCEMVSETLSSNIAVSDTGHDRIQIFSFEGDALNRIARSATLPMRRPQCLARCWRSFLAIACDDTVYLVNLEDSAPIGVLRNAPTVRGLAIFEHLGLAALVNYKSEVVQLLKLGSRGAAAIAAAEVEAPEPRQSVAAEASARRVGNARRGPTPKKVASALPSQGAASGAEAAAAASRVVAAMRHGGVQ